MTALLEVDQLAVQVSAGGTWRELVHNVSFTIGREEAVALVGESGSGKSVTARTIMRLLPKGARVQGGLRFDGRSIMDLDTRALRAFRSGDVGMIFQDPRAHINPVRTIGDFLTEGLTTNRSMPVREARKRVAALLDEVGVSRVEHRLEQYPHELSGGLLQRVMIAAVLAMEPRLILADEPTTALDVTTQSEVMGILDELRRERGVGLLFITHDLDLAAAVCDRTVVMYAGQIVEEQDSKELHRRPAHPYSAALTASRPSLRQRSDRLMTIPGRPLSAVEAPETGCPFAPRCRFAADVCTTAKVELRPVGERAKTACVRVAEIQPALIAEGALDHA